MKKIIKRGVAQLGLERFLGVEEIGGSNPLTPTKLVRIGLIGMGTVGTGVAKVLLEQSAELEKKTGLRLELKKACVRSLVKKRLVSVPKGVLTSRVQDILGDPSIDIVVELIGGIHPAKEILKKAFQAGKHVVTANKALLAEQGRELFAAAAATKRRLGIEASVCGGIPVIKAIREGLVSNRVTSLLGIVNGTCNYILTAMSERGVSFDEALKNAKDSGYAEANPALDIDGVDSAHKLAVLARLAFGSEIPFRSIAVEGIRGLAAADIAYAKELGYAIKLLAIGKKLPAGLELRVHPTLLHLDHPLAHVRDVYNAVFLHADQAGDLLLYGKGAGMHPTASAVVADIVDIAASPGTDGSENGVFSGSLPVLPIGSTFTKYYLRFQVADKPGVLGAIAESLGSSGISILSVHQKEAHSTGSVPVIILTYEAEEKALREALKIIDANRMVREKTIVIRVEN